jgi:hypothetical protein
MSWPQDNRTSRSNGGSREVLDYQLLSAREMNRRGLKDRTGHTVNDTIGN